jgi:ribosomal protein S16
MSPTSEITLRQSSPSAGKFSVPDRTDTVGRLIAYLRNQHPVKTADNVSARTGVKAETVQKWLDQGCAPSWTAVLAIVMAYGPEALANVLGDRAPAWLSAAHREAEAARLDREIEELKARRASLRA